MARRTALICAIPKYRRDDVVLAERGREFLVNIGEEALVVDQSVEQATPVDPIVAQGCDKRCRLPMAMRDFVDEPLAALHPAMAARHVGFRASLVDEDEALGVDQALMFAPTRTVTANVLAGGLLKQI
jgi:hypothetical protein